MFGNVEGGFSEDFEGELDLFPSDLVVEVGSLVFSFNLVHPIYYKSNSFYI